MGNYQNAAARYRRLPPERRRTRRPADQHHGQVAGGGGFSVGIGVSLTVLDGCLLLIPDSREEMRLRVMEQQLNAQ